jgi:pimeloyl-ACP methyl ester carboxylesterase
MPVQLLYGCVAKRCEKETFLPLFDVMQIWRGMAHNVRGVAISQCGHLPPEEQPDAVNKELLTFLECWAGQ